jgi:hypothetical protein
MTVGLLLLALLLSGADAHRRYHPVAIGSPAFLTHTHAEVTGRVAQVIHEADGDIHLRLTAPDGHFVIAEIIPAVPMVAPQVGLCIRAWGITRFDVHHAWSELHPLEGWVLVHNGSCAAASVPPERL